MKRKFEPRPAQHLEVEIGDEKIVMVIRRFKGGSSDDFVAYSQKVKSGEVPTFSETKEQLKKIISNWDEKIEAFIDDLDLDYLQLVIGDVMGLAAGTAYDEEEKKSPSTEKPMS